MCLPYRPGQLSDAGLSQMINGRRCASLPALPSLWPVHLPLFVAVLGFTRQFWRNYSYILSTGAGWKGSIGSADVIVRLPYEANSFNVLLSTDSWNETSRGAVLEGNKIRWRFENLEPTPEDNLKIELVMPSVWQKVLKEQANVGKNPEDGEAWGRLGKLYKEIAFLPKKQRMDQGWPGVFEQSRHAYEKCIELLPNDATWHAGFSELYYWRFLSTNLGKQNHGDDEDLQLALKLLQTALAIDPGDSKVIELLEQFDGRGYVGKKGDTYDFLYLTASPTMRPEPTMGIELVLSVTPTESIGPDMIQPVETPIPLGEAPATPDASTTASLAAAQATLTEATAITPSKTLSASETQAAPIPGAATSLCGAALMVLPSSLAVALFSKRGAKRATRPG
jgi:tetratricopeptide (TPR) repeat protein